VPLAGHGLRPTPLRRRASRPQLKRDPIGGAEVTSPMPSGVYGLDGHCTPMILHHIARSCRSLVVGAVLAVSACCSSGDTTGAGTPPSEPTHHTLVEGFVTDATGRGLAGVGVGARFAETPCSDRQLSVTGGTYTQADGSYRFTVEATTPSRADGVAAFRVHATVYAPPGGRAREASAFVTARFVPLNETPNLVHAPTLRLPNP